MSRITLPLRDGIYTLAFGHSLKHSLLTAVYGSQKRIIVSDRVADDDNSIMKQRWILKHFKESDTYTIENIFGGYLTPDPKAALVAKRPNTLMLSAKACQWYFKEHNGYLWIFLPNSTRNVQVPLAPGETPAPVMLESRLEYPTNGQCLLESVKGFEALPKRQHSSVRPTLYPTIFRLVATTSRGRQFLSSSRDGILSITSGSDGDDSSHWVCEHTPESRTWTLQNVRTKTYLSFALKKSKNVLMAVTATHWSLEQSPIVGMYTLKVPYAERMLGMSKKEGSVEVSLRGVEDAITFECEPVYLRSGTVLRGPISDGIHAIHARSANDSLLNFTVLPPSVDGQHELQCRPYKAIITDNQKLRFTREPRTGFYFIQYMSSNAYLRTSRSLAGHGSEISVQCGHEPQLWQIQVPPNSSSVTFKLPWTEWCITVDQYTQQLVLKQRLESDTNSEDESFEFTMSDLNKTVTEQSEVELTADKIPVGDNDSDSGDSETVVSEAGGEEDNQKPVQTDLFRRIPRTQYDTFLVCTGSVGDISLRRPKNGRQGSTSTGTGTLTVRHGIDRNISVIRADSNSSRSDVSID